MNGITVQTILLPLDGRVALTPRVSSSDRISDAIRKMLAADVRRIVVFRKGRPIGVVRLEDALALMGLGGKTPFPSHPRMHPPEL